MPAPAPGKRRGGKPRNTRMTRKGGSESWFVPECWTVSFEADRFAVELPLVLRFDAEVGERGNGCIDEIDLLGKRAALGGRAAKDEEAVENFGRLVPATVAGAF